MPARVVRRWALPTLPRCSSRHRCSSLAPALTRRVTSWTFRALFALGLVAYAFVLQFTTSHLASIDGYFHMRYSALLRDVGWRGFPPEFPWLPLTILSPERYFDHHFLFHWWLALFAGMDLVMGAKIAAA